MESQASRMSPEGIALDTGDSIARVASQNFRPCPSLKMQAIAQPIPVQTNSYFFKIKIK